jgi:hypothetical protein
MKNSRSFPGRFLLQRRGAGTPPIQKTKDKETEKRVIYYAITASDGVGTARLSLTDATFQARDVFPFFFLFLKENGVPIQAKVARYCVYGLKKTDMTAQ